MSTQTILINGVKNSCLHHNITRSNIIKERWDELETICQVHNISNCVYLRKKLTRLRTEDDKSIGEHIHVFRTIHDELIVVGGAIDANEKIEFFLGNIFYSYCIVIDILNNKSTIAHQITMSRLLKEELKRKPYGTPNGKIIKKILNKEKFNFQNQKGNFINKNIRPTSNKSNNSNEKNMKKVKCFNCK